MKYLVIGGGSIGQRHHSNLQALGADASLLPWRGADLAALDLANVAGVVVATATQVRTEIIQLAAEAEVPVYIEKPLTFRMTDLDEIERLTERIANRSVLGLMMRYHPAIRYLAAEPLNAYSAKFSIGHDVRQWRENWRFADSYAAKPEGGGVLLDLCHELDMAHCLFPDLALQSVDCVGHADFPGVDFSTQVELHGQGRLASVAMDYLAPEGFRTIVLKGREEVAEIDLLACEGRRWRNGRADALSWTFERNDMFLGLMRDFMALAEGRKPSDNPSLPRLDRVWDSARLTAKAWETRAFRAQIEGGFA